MEITLKRTCIKCRKNKKLKRKRTCRGNTCGGNTSEKKEDLQDSRRVKAETSLEMIWMHLAVLVLSIEGVPLLSNLNNSELFASEKTG